VQRRQTEKATKTSYEEGISRKVATEIASQSSLEDPSQAWIGMRERIECSCCGRECWSGSLIPSLQRDYRRGCNEPIESGFS
jgi:hypothetical protein